MMFITDTLDMLLLELDEKSPARELLEARRYRASDSPLTYRQINGLSLFLADMQEDEGKWRKFSFMELLFLEVIKELRGFGFTVKQLKGVHQTFFRSKKVENADRVATDGFAFIAVTHVLRGTQVILAVHPDSTATFYDGVFFSLLGMRNTEAFVYINFNSIVSELLKKVNKKASLPEFKTALDVMSERLSLLSEKENELLGLIRSNDYKTIRVHKKNEDEWIVHGEKGGDVDGKSLKELLETIVKHDYQKITVQKRGGKIAQFMVEDTLKL